MGLYDSGVINAFNQQSAVVTPIMGVAINYYPNRAPLFARLDAAPLGSVTFKLISDNFRPATTTVNEGATFASGDTTLTVADGSSFMSGDVVEIETEALLVTAVSGNNLTVTRGYAGTTAASHADTTKVYLVANTRSGNETEQAAISRQPTVFTQYAQTIQHPYQVGGNLASSTDYALPPGVPSVTDKFRLDAIRNTADDIERSYYYGRGVALASGSKPMMYGFRSILTTNNTTAPTNGSAYKPSDLVRDAIQPCFDNGGEPDVLLVSTNFLTGLSVWGVQQTRLDAAATVFGVSIDAYSVPFLPNLTIVPAPLLRAGTAIAFNRNEVRQRVKRGLFDKPRGSRGDATEGDILGEYSLEVENQQHHSYVEGITGFAAP